MKRDTWIWLGAGCFFICLIVCGLAGFGIFAGVKAGVKGYQTAASNIDTELAPLVTKVLTTLDNATFRDALTTDARNDQPEAVTEAWLSTFRTKYGPLQSLGKATMSNLNQTSYNGVSTEEVQLSYPATFEKGSGSVVVDAIKRSNKWQISKIRID